MAARVSAAAEVPTATPDVDTAAAAAIEAITDRFGTAAIADLDVSVSAAAGTLTVDVYIDVPAADADEIQVAADVAVEAAVDTFDGVR